MGGEEEASEQCAQEVVAMAGAQRLLLTAVGSAPAQPELAKEKQGWEKVLKSGTEDVELGNTIGADAGPEE